MGKIIASCGCQIKPKQIDKGTVHVKSLAWDGSRAISYLVLCSKCLRQARKHKIVLETQIDRQNWMSGKMKKGKWIW